MREVEGPHQAWTEEVSDEQKAVAAALEAQLLVAERAQEAKNAPVGPTETEMVTLTLLMRLYDVGITLLEHFDKDVAEQLWQKHNNGEHFNPAIFLPVLKDDED